MSDYSIKDLERITGVKAHTIRIWEKRYGLIAPRRTDSNIRLYCDEDVKKLLNVSILLKHGMKISRLAQLDQHDLSNKILEVSVLPNGMESQIENLVVAMIELDESKFEKTLSRAIIRNGFESTLFEVIYPFFEKVGVLWQAGSINPAQEHFITNLIKQKIYVAIDSIPLQHVSDQKTVVMFLPEWELHELGMLVYIYFLKKQGLKVVYLGQKVPQEDLCAVNNLVNPDYLICAFSSPMEKERLLDYIISLSEKFTGKKIYITGYHAGCLEDHLPSNISIIRDAMHFRDEILPVL
jgi:MerR family transcriptional regulator, light-induced transcriptional regulator